MTYVTHLFMPQQTIKGIIRRYNNMVSDPLTLDLLLAEFNEINDHKLPKAGQSFKIPVIDDASES